tara:strand:+ start:329 stop:604 length:276 start_codon:yes stop_codon:yes gene_type:complete
MTTVKIVHANYNDSVEDWILDDMIQQTMKPFFAWQEDTGTDVTFIKHWGVSGYYPIVEVVAEFKSEIDSALFITSFSDLPQKNLLSPTFSP